MERKLITSIINGILRHSFDSELCVREGIALLICRSNDAFIAQHFSKEEFDYEKLFVDGQNAAYQIDKHVPTLQIRLLCENFALTAEILYLKDKGDGLNIFGEQNTISGEGSLLLFSLLDAHHGATVYNPFGGDLSAPVKNPDIRFVASYQSTSSLVFAQLVQVARGLRNVEFTMAPSPVFTYINPEYTPEGGEKEYDRVYIPAMPFGMQVTGLKRKAEEMCLLSALKQLRPGGRMVFVTPASALAAENYFELRKTLLERGILRRVILFGEKFLYESTGISTAAFVVENTEDPQRSYWFHDLTKVPFDAENLYYRVMANDGEISVSVPYSAAFSSRNAQLYPPSAPAVRLNRPGFKYVKLGELLSVYTNNVTLDGTEMVARLSGKDMHLTLPEYMIDIQDVEVTPAKGRFTKITEPVFCFHGITQNYVWCVGEPDYPVYCNSDVYTFRIYSNLITPEYLCFILDQEDIKADIQSRVEKRTIPRINKWSFLEVEIPVPDRDRQDLITQDLQQFVSAQKTMLSEQEKRSHEATIEDIREDIKDKIHLLGPYNTNIQTGIYRVIKMLQRGGKLEAGSKVFKDSDIELLGFLKSLLVKSEDAGYIMASIGESIFEAVDRPLDIFTFIQEYVARLQSDDEYEGVSFEITPIEKPAYLMITERSLRLVLDTIVRNAVLHGFAEPFSGERRIRFTIDADSQSSYAVISVANNGLPAAEGFNESLYESKFGKCGPTAHSGRGGYFVSKAMEFYKGYVVVTTDDPQWPFNVLLHIPVSHD